MKTTDHFKRTIQVYLDEQAAKDSLFAVHYQNEKKNLEECILYILNAVKQSGCNGFSDMEIYSLALHYYTEPNIEVGKPCNCSVIVNHTITLTDEEKAEARKQAIKRAQDEAYAHMKQPAKKAKPIVVNNQPTLFD
jgi:hypothetical protein